MKKRLALARACFSNPQIFFKFLAVMGVGILVSVLMGAAIGTWSKNQMMSTGIAMPIMMVFSFWRSMIFGGNLKSRKYRIWFLIGPIWLKICLRENFYCIDTFTI